MYAGLFSPPPRVIRPSLLELQTVSPRLVFTQSLIRSLKTKGERAEKEGRLIFPSN